MSRFLKFVPPSLYSVTLCESTRCSRMQESRSFTIRCHPPEVLDKLLEDLGEVERISGSFQKGDDRVQVFKGPLRVTLSRSPGDSTTFEMVKEGRFTESENRLLNDSMSSQSRWSTKWSHQSSQNDDIFQFGSRPDDWLRMLLSEMSHEVDFLPEQIKAYDDGQTEPRDVISEESVKKFPAQTALEEFGCTVALPSFDDSPWKDLAGYEDTKRRIEDTVLVGLKHADFFSSLAEKTRGSKTNSSRPRVVLFEGPPGTGKTSTAKIVSNSCGLPFVYLPMEAIVSKWFGESEKSLARIFTLINTLSKEAGTDGVLLFIDEVDTVASSRDSGIHEVSKKMLSVLLRQVDGFATEQGRSLLICATNRKEDLDSAFISRVDTSILFPMPDEKNRCAIFRKYAQQLNDEDIKLLAKESRGLSGRNIKDLAADAERTFIADSIRAGKKEITVPDLSYYINALKQKHKQMLKNPRGLDAIY